MLDKMRKTPYNIVKIESKKGLYMNRIYLDHAATTPLDDSVLQKMMPYFTEFFGNADSPHGIGRRAVNAVDCARDDLAQALGVKSNELYFTSGGTEADNWAIIGGAYAQKTKGKDHVIVSAIEHHAALYAAERLEKEGFTVTYLPVNAGGMVEEIALQNALTNRTGLVAVMAVNNETGTIQPIKALAELAHARDTLFFTDAVQAAPHLPLDIKGWNVDMLSISSHKFYGPKGCGVLYVKNGVKIDRFIGGGEQERGLRGGTTNVPAVVGLSTAYCQNLKDMSVINEKIDRLSKLFLDGISSLSGVSINGQQPRLPAILNLRVKGVSNVDLLYKLDLKGVCVAVGSACASASVKPSHVLLAMGLSEADSRECVRISFGKENTEEEIRFAANAFVEAVNDLRKF